MNKFLLLMAAASTVCFAASSSTDVASADPIAQFIEQPIARFSRRIEASNDLLLLNDVTKRAAEVLHVPALALNKIFEKRNVPLQFFPLHEQIIQKGKALIGDRFEDLIKDLAKDGANVDGLLAQYLLPENPALIAAELEKLAEFERRVEAVQSITDLYYVAQEAGETFDRGLSFVGRNFDEDKLHARYLPLKALIAQKGGELIGPDRFKEMLSEVFSTYHNRRFGEIRYAIQKFERGIDLVAVRYHERIKQTDDLRGLLSILGDAERELPFVYKFMDDLSCPNILETITRKGEGLVGRALFAKILDANPKIDPVETFVENPIAQLRTKLEDTETAEEVQEVMKDLNALFGSNGFRTPSLYTLLKEEILQKGREFMMDLNPPEKSGKKVQKLTQIERETMQELIDKIQVASTHRELYLFAEEAGNLDSGLCFGGLQRTIGVEDRFQPLYNLIWKKGIELMGEKRFDDMISEFLRPFTADEIIDEYDDTIDHSTVRQKMSESIQRVKQARCIRELFTISQQAGRDLSPTLYNFAYGREHDLLKYRDLRQAMQKRVGELVGNHWVGRLRFEFNK